MKIFFKIIVSIVYAPLLLIAVIIGLIRALFMFTVLFTWEISGDVCESIVISVDSGLQKLKSDDKSNS